MYIILLFYYVTIDVPELNKHILAKGPSFPTHTRYHDDNLYSYIDKINPNHANGILSH